MRGIAQGERGGVAEAAVCFSTGGELLRAKRAFPTARRAAQGSSGADGVPQLPWVMAEVLFGDEVL